MILIFIIYISNRGTIKLLSINILQWSGNCHTRELLQLLLFSNIKFEKKIGKTIN